MPAYAVVKVDTHRVRRVPSPQTVEACKTPAGGWTRKQLAAWGVQWPPRQGRQNTRVETDLIEVAFVGGA